MTETYPSIDELDELSFRSYAMFVQAKLMSSIFDLEKLLEVAIDAFVELMRVDVGFIILFDEKSQQLSVEAVKGLKRHTIRKTRINVDKDIIQWISERKAAIVLSELEKETLPIKMFFQEMAEKVGGDIVSSIPLVVKKNLVGLVNLGKREFEKPFKKADLQFLYIFAEQVAITIQNANLHQKKIEEEKLRIKLETSSRLKSQFLANMSHELRTPLNSIIGFTGIILQGLVGELNDEQKKQLNMVYDNAKHLLALINDILDLSKIEAGKIEIIPAQFEVRELIHTVEKMVSPLIEEKGLTLEVAISEDVPPTIYNDKNRIKQVLINLLSNAIKFTESGEIRLSIRISDLKEGEIPSIQHPASSIVFSVSDTGIGIKPEHLPDVFDEFKQIEDSLKEKPVGTGLGLAISRKMVEMMGGRIRAESEYGKGSCFQFVVSIKERRRQKDRRKSRLIPETLDLGKKLVLTIDDGVEAQEILKTYLKSKGYEVIQAYNAMEAMELARKYRPFAITLEIIMPGKDGWDILHELKKDPLTKGIPVICISVSDNREMGLSSGAFEYLVKPVGKDQLTEELQRIEKRFRIDDIMFVDDEAQAAELLTQYLSEKDKYVVRKVYGGEDGLSGAPYLIILDLMMPEIDGFEVIRHLKKSEETRNMPIIIVSAKKGTQEEIEYLSSNIEKVIRKGDFRKVGLLKDIKKTLDKIV